MAARCILSAMRRPWYPEGLRFSCTQCGDCCTGRPGYVWVSPSEVEAIATLLEISLEEMAKRYLRNVGSRVSLIERPNGDCVFYSSGCTIYPVRPVQCRTFPFWPENLRTAADWGEAASECPGMGKGRLYSPQEIAQIRDGKADASKA